MMWKHWNVVLNHWTGKNMMWKHWNVVLNHWTGKHMMWKHWNVILNHWTGKNMMWKHWNVILNHWTGKIWCENTEMSNWITKLENPAEQYTIIGLIWGEHRKLSTLRKNNLSKVDNFVVTLQEGYNCFIISKLL